MESFLIAIAPELITLAGTILVALAGWGIALLRQKVKIEAGKKALDTIDSIISAVVGNLSQTVAKGIKAKSKDGHLPKSERATLKLKAMNEARILISKEIAKAASKAVSNVNEYVAKKIEDQVLASKIGK
ncbi:hypothetical protein KAR91_07270 [Candidatus Pacearchaeota archaeon]|nr:hypothetical protein [Candidatus Pacearchaeota archaeon]